MNFKKRIEQAKQFLREKNLDLFLIEESTDLLYLTGLHLSSAKLYLHKMGGMLFVDGRFLEVAKEKSPCEVSLIKNEMEFLQNFRKKFLGFDSHVMSVENFEKFSWKVKEFALELVPIPQPLRRLRAIKDEEEILLLKKAAKITWEGLCFAKNELKEGMTEKEMALVFEFFCRKHGADKLSFDPIICFGVHGANPHHEPTTIPFKKGSSLLMDVGVVFENYCADVTRCFFGEGVDPIFQKIYEIVKRAQKKALSFCRPGVQIKELDLAAREEIGREGYAEAFVHSLGHGVGLNVHEFPRLRQDIGFGETVLEKGMVITVEPGIYLPEKGGVRYEDTVVVTETGYENFYPEE